MQSGGGRELTQLASSGGRELMQSAKSGGGGELTQFASSGGGGSQGKREPERGENTGRSMRHIKCYEAIHKRTVSNLL